ncbi:unnamed protein product [Vicia faba]|uniref:Uncharacterized protein n=1 Tax=Vicia faba TaxID=3906 RepID=A0AAV0YVW1_VICFA|nr:unnamed protein product [Vicia faba]
MWCFILTRNLFESRDDYEKTELELSEEITKLKDAQKAQSEKVFALEMRLAEDKRRKESLESESHTSIAWLTAEVKATKDSNDELHKALKKSQVDILSVGDEVFERTKEKVLCLHHGLDLSEVDYFKVVQDGRLMDLEEVVTTIPVEPNPEATVVKVVNDGKDDLDE